MTSIMEYLRRAVAGGASDVFIVAGGPVSCKCSGQLLPISEAKVFPP